MVALEHVVILENIVFFSTAFRDQPIRLNQTKKKNDKNNKVNVFINRIGMEQKSKWNSKLVVSKIKLIEYYFVLA